MHGLRYLGTMFLPLCINQAMNVLRMASPPMEDTFKSFTDEQLWGNVSDAMNGDISRVLDTSVQTQYDDSLDNSLIVYADKGSAHRCTSSSCGAEFTLIVRKHHCRACGNVFCGNCCRNKKISSVQDSKRETIRQRLCHKCNDKLMADIHAESRLTDSIQRPVSTRVMKIVEEYNRLSLSTRKARPTRLLSSSATVTPSALGNQNSYEGSKFVEIVSDSDEEFGHTLSKVFDGEGDLVQNGASSTSHCAEPHSLSFDHAEIELSHSHVRSMLRREMPPRPVPPSVPVPVDASTSASQTARLTPNPTKPRSNLFLAQTAPHDCAALPTPPRSRALQPLSASQVNSISPKPLNSELAAKTRGATGSSINSRQGQGGKDKIKDRVKGKDKDKGKGKDKDKNKAKGKENGVEKPSIELPRPLPPPNSEVHVVTPDDPLEAFDVAASCMNLQLDWDLEAPPVEIASSPSWLDRDNEVEVVDHWSYPEPPFPSPSLVPIRSQRAAALKKAAKMDEGRPLMVHGVSEEKEEEKHQPEKEIVGVEKKRKPIEGRRRTKKPLPVSSPAAASPRAGSPSSRLSWLVLLAGLPLFLLCFARVALDVRATLSVWCSREGLRGGRGLRVPSQSAVVQVPSRPSTEIEETERSMERVRGDAEAKIVGGERERLLARSKSAGLVLSRLPVSVIDDEEGNAEESRSGTMRGAERLGAPPVAVVDRQAEADRLGVCIPALNLPQKIVIRLKGKDKSGLQQSPRPSPRPPTLALPAPLPKEAAEKDLTIARSSNEPPLLRKAVSWKTSLVSFLKRLRDHAKGLISRLLVILPWTRERI